MLQVQFQRFVLKNRSSLLTTCSTNLKRSVSSFAYLSNCKHEELRRNDITQVSSKLFSQSCIMHPLPRLLPQVKSRNHYPKGIAQSLHHKFVFVRQETNFSSKPVLSSNEEDDDLKAILKDKSLGITAKFKIVFQQYGAVMVGVHIATSIVWIALFYFAVSRGLDILPYLERWGVFEHLEKWGFSYTEKLKSSGASDYLMTYLIYEIAKPIRYIVTLFGTMYCVRYLRRKGFFKRPPKAPTVGSLVQTQSKIMGNRLRRTTKKYEEKYKNRIKVRSKRRRQSKNGNSTAL